MDIFEGLSERQREAVETIDDDLEIIACAGAGKTGVVTRRMAELDISRATVFRDYAKIKKVTGAMYDKKTSTWTL